MLNQDDGARRSRVSELLVDYDSFRDGLWNCRAESKNEVREESWMNISHHCCISYAKHVTGHETPPQQQGWKWSKVK